MILCNTILKVLSVSEGLHPPDSLQVIHLNIPASQVLVVPLIQRNTEYLLKQ